MKKQIRFDAPEKLVKEFDQIIAETPEMLNRTSEFLRFMAAAVKKHERAKAKDGKQCSQQ